MLDCLWIPSEDLIGYGRCMTNISVHLPDDVPALQVMVRERDFMIEKLKHQLAGHQRHRFGGRSETSDQLALKIEDREIGVTSTGLEVDVAESQKAKPKRAPLPPQLPRQTETLSAGGHCSVCGGRLKQLGEDVTEVLIVTEN